MIVSLAALVASAAAQKGPKITVSQVLKDPFKIQKTTVYPWKKSITATVFWIGEKPTARNPTPNNKSSWDQKWEQNYGGYDNPDPKARRGYLPKGFTPGQNPFYIALPYNDCLTYNKHRPEAARVIPWFNRLFLKPGRSVCKGRWIQIYCPQTRRVCYGQWEDVGPFTVDDYEYVFGNKRPKNRQNHGAGIDISPAIRDYLGVGNKVKLHWRFVELSRVPRGPWSKYGSNNPFVNKAVNTDLAEQKRYFAYLKRLRDEAQRRKR